MRFRFLLALAALLAGALASAGEGEPPAIVGGKRWAFVIGAGNYENYGKLSYTVADAHRLAALLKAKFGFEDGTVKVLADDAGDRMTPTAGHILGELAVTLADKRLDKSDLFLFYFTGHGTGLPSGDYLVPLDARRETVEQLGVPVRKVVQQIVDAGLKNVLIIADACRSGEKNTFGEELRTLADRAKIAVMLGCEPGQQSREDPDLKSGVFSHFLRKALEDSSLRDPTCGALWARKVAETVSAEAYRHGQRTHGKYAQKPTAWTDPTRDVLLGVFPGSAAPSAAREAFLEAAKALDRPSYAAALNEFGSRLFDASSFADAIEVFKVLDQIGELRPDSRYAYCVALGMTDRVLEASRLLATFGTAEEASFYRDLAIASTASASVPNSERLAAARRVWQIDKSWAAGAICWTQFKYYGKQDEKEAFLLEFAAAMPGKGRLQSVIQGEMAMVQGRFPDAAKAFREALRQPHPHLPDEMVLLYLHEAMLQYAPDKEIVDFLLHHAKGPNGGIWGTLLGIRWMAQGKTDQAIEKLRESIPRHRDASYLWIAVKTAGPRAGELAEPIAAAASQHPLAWTAQLAKAMSSGLKDGGVEGALQAYAGTRSLMDDPADYAFEAVTFLTKCVEAGLASGKVDAKFATLYYQIASAELIPHAGRLGVDFEFWLEFAQVLLKAEKNALLAELVGRQYDAVRKPAEIPPSLAVSLWLSWANVGNAEQVEALLAKAKIAERDRAELSLVLATFRACRGQFAEARAALPAKSAFEGGLLDELREAVHGWLLAEEGKSGEALAIAEKHKGTTTVNVQPIVGLIYAKLGKWDEAMPFLLASRTQRSWGFIYAHERALRTLLEHDRAVLKSGLADILVYESSIQQPGNPLFAEWHYGMAPGVAAYAGTLEYSAAGNSDWGEPIAGKLTLTVLPSGKATGLLEADIGRIVTLAGTVDKFGNLSGKAKLGTAEFAVLAKLAPAESAPTFEFLKTQGLLFQLSRADGTRMVWFARPGAT